MTLSSLRKGAMFLAVALAFGAMAHSGELPVAALPVFGAAWLAALLGGERLARRMGAALNLATLALMGLLTAVWLAGTWDLILSSALFAGAIAANRLLARRTPADDGAIYLAALLMVAAGAVLTGTIAFGVYFAGFAVVVTFALALSLLERAAVEHDAPSAAVRRLLSRPLLGAVATLSVLSLVGAIAVFFFFPRFTTGFLGRRAAAGRPTSGFSETMRLGGFGTVKDDPRVVAHVTLAPDPGADRLELRWRGRAFERFDGRTWLPTTGRPTLPSRRVPLAERSEPARELEVEILPDGGSPAVFLPEGAFEVSSPRRIPVRGPPRTLFFETDALGNVALQPRPEMGYGYQVLAGAKATAARGLGDAYPEDVAARCLALPPGLDPRVPALAREWTAGLADPLDKALAIERRLGQGYSYTLDLPGDRPDPIAHFLLERKAGHCEFFASAMTVLLRSVGVPARNASGYFGGQRTGPGEYVLRAGDAHAWTEVYFPQVGFVVFDPTPPAARPSSASSWRQRWADTVDRMQAAWLRLVIDYSYREQFAGASAAAQAVLGIVRRIQGGKSPPVLRILAALAAVVLGFWAARRLWRSGDAGARRSAGAVPLGAREAVLLYRALLKKLARRGIAKRPGQTPRELVEALGAARRPEHAVAAEVVERYLEARFGGRTLAASERERLRQAVKAL